MRAFKLAAIVAFFFALSGLARAVPSSNAMNARSYTSAGVTFQFLSNGSVVPQLPGTWVWCPDCSPTPTCTGGGTGEFAFLGISGWACNYATGTGGGGSFSGVTTDSSLNGAGTVASPLGVKVPLTGAQGGTHCASPTPYTDLPLSPTIGDSCMISNANSCVQGVAITSGGGSTPCRGDWNGTNWMPTGNASFSDLQPIGHGGTGCRSPSLFSALPSVDGSICLIADANACNAGAAISGGGSTPCLATRISGSWMPGGNLAASASSPITTLGDTVVGGSSGTPTRVAGNTSTTKQFYEQTGTGSVSAQPTWGGISATDITSALTAPPAIGGTTPAAGTFSALAATSTVKLPAAVAVASLPASPGTGAWLRVVNDWNGTAGTCTGGGANTTLAVWDGTNWKCAGGSGGSTVSGFNASIAAISGCAGASGAGGGTYSCYQPISGSSLNLVRCNLTGYINTTGTPDVCVFTTPFTQIGGFTENSWVPATINLSGNVPVSMNMPIHTSPNGINSEIEFEAQ